VTVAGAACYGGFGRAMLEKLGWTRREPPPRPPAPPPSRRRSGKGLGKNEDGASEALKPKKKEDLAGV